MPFEPKPLPDDVHDSCRISRVVIWQNGMAMVFCEHGQQMPYYQGPWAVLKDRIMAAHPERIEHHNWTTAGI